jgi:hypothetical protein
MTYGAPAVVEIEASRFRRERRQRDVRVPVVGRADRCVGVKQGP